MNRPTTLREAIERADAILIGAGAGLSAADGDNHSGPVFDERFADFRAERGITDAYSGGFYPVPTPEERWAFWSRMISLLRYEAGPGQAYSDLLDLVRGRDYFVITTNVDHRFQNSGFDKERLFRAITGCCSARVPATTPRTTTSRGCARRWPARRACASRRS